LPPAHYWEAEGACWLLLVDNCCVVRQLTQAGVLCSINWWDSCPFHWSL